MSYSTVVLHLDDLPGIDGRTDQALRLARRFESHLVGLAAADHGLFGLALATGFAGTPSLAHALDDARAAAQRRAQAFRQRAAAWEEPVSCEAVVVDDDDVTALVARSVCSDLLVLGWPDTAAPDLPRRRDQLEQVILQSVAPTLILPSAEARDPIGRRVLIAWDGSHGAARAVVGALPVLRQADRVHLVRCETAVEVDGGVEVGGFDLPREWLARHGVRVDARLERSGSDVGTALLAQAASLGADLMVMGAWGMPRWAERLVGGTTRTLLARMSVPLLMAR